MVTKDLWADIYIRGPIYKKNIIGDIFDISINFKTDIYLHGYDFDYALKQLRTHKN